VADGTARCWGENWSGQVGDGTTTTRLSPVPVAGLDHATSVSAGGLGMCARLGSYEDAVFSITVDAGTVKCWGGNSLGQLGDGTTTDRLTPVAVSGLTGATSVSAGSDHSCAALVDGTARCWGDNGYGQLAEGGPFRSLPVTVLWRR
jgi:hypothetical protein